MVPLRIGSPSRSMHRLQRLQIKYGALRNEKRPHDVPHAKVDERSRALLELLQLLQSASGTCLNHKYSFRTDWHTRYKRTNILIGLLHQVVVRRINKDKKLDNLHTRRCHNCKFSFDLSECGNYHSLTNETKIF